MSGITRDATVHVKAEVDDDIATTAERIFSPLERAAQGVQSKLGAVASTTAQTFANVAIDIARVSTALGAIDLGSSVNRYVRYREEVARTAASVGSDWQALSGKYKAVGDKLAISDESVAKFTRGLQQATYDASDSSKAIEALGSEALATNRSLDQMAPIGEALHNELGQQFDDIPDALARVRTAAETLGTTGGPAALEVQIANLGASISQFSLKSKADFAAAVGSLAALGRGLPAPQQARVQQRVMGRLQSDTEGLRRQLGVRYEEFYDEQGHVREDVGGIIERIQQMATRRWGLRAREVLSQPQNFGNAETAAAVMAFNRADERRAAEAALTSEAADKARAFRVSEVGEDIAKRHRIEQNKRDKGGGALAGAQAYVGEWMSEHPFVSLFGVGAGGQLAGQFVRWAFRGGAAGGVGKAAAPAMRAAGAGIEFLGGSVAGNLLGGVGLAALTYKALDAAGLGRFNESIEPFRKQLTQQSEATRRGRVYAIVRAAERASASGFTPEAYREQLGPRLMGEIARDPALQSAAAGAINGGVPAGLEQQAPQLAAALRDALKEVQLNVQVQLQDDTGSPHRVVAARKGAKQ